MYSYGFWGMSFMMVFMVLFWAVLFFGIVYWSTSVALERKDRKNSYNNALAILKERFARGEIDEEEFRRMKELLH